MSIITIRSYKDNKTKKYCISLKEANKKFGDKIGIKLHQLINFIENANTLADVACMPMYKLHELKGNRKGTCGIDIAGRKCSYRLIIKPVIEKESEKTDWISRCEHVTIIDIEEVSNHYG